MSRGFSGSKRVIKGAFHLPRNSRNSGWDVNGTHVFRALQWKFSKNKWNFEKVALFSSWRFSSEKTCSIYEFSQLITSSRLFMATSVPPSPILVTRAQKNRTCVKWNTFFTRWNFSWKFPNVFGKWKTPKICRYKKTLTSLFILENRK